MRITDALNHFDGIRMAVFQKRCNLSLLNKIALSLLMAVVTGVFAQIKIALPWTPIPITAQTFAVLLAGVLLGKWWGGVSQAVYVAFGAAGVPWFAGLTGGHAALLGPSGGYLIGFIFAAFFLGWLSDTYIRARSFVSMLVFMGFANFILIHGPGLAYLAVWLNLINGKGLDLWQVFMMGTVPFIVGDVTKIAAAALFAKGITPKKAFNGEVDAEKVKKWRLP